ncbi:MAG: ROK family protein [Spirochaetaceae bacterium]|nr:MAG: ROK family protein [Spirochaetaceae bacterium]
MNKTTVSNLVNELMQESLLKESLATTSEKGRKPIILSINNSQSFFFAVDIKVGLIYMALYDLAGERRNLITIKKENPHLNPEALIDDILYQLEGLCRQNGYDLRSVHSIGVSVPGMIDLSTNEVIFSPNLGWHHVELGEIAERKLPSWIRFQADNDANLALEAEIWKGDNIPPRTSTVFVSVNRGVGTGISFGGGVYRGNTYGAGAFGHTIVSADGPVCSCGQRGCWERYVSVQKLITDYYGEEGETKDIDRALSLIRLRFLDGDAKAKKVIHEEAYWLALGIANICLSLDPQLIIVGGYIRRMWDLLGDSVTREVQRRLSACSKGNIKIVGSSFDGWENLEGAAILAMSVELPFQF